ncbi:parallel beta-helix repeat (two copies) [Friedmanniella luteola]|uniref:Parallel beta-helix repeat (Two copies) n=1 Tax=Friedmanniella luteola TaxID=546871 RepID=A0A1H1LP42_9ACTN|nr:right-handed parallel beta-helix repeat-containing protein [Friedmanniella luteola]SDR75785.1 parallel beta-helix repeat (two copies) [Friedmanniella luteola]
MPSSSTVARRRWALPVAGLASTVLASIALTAAPSLAAAATTIATDGFDRSAASGWGAAPSGGAWSVTGGASRSVAGSAATVAGVGANRSFRASLPAVKLANGTVRAAFTVPKGTQVYYSAEARRQANGTAYGSRARIDANRKLHTEVVRVAGGAATVLASKVLGTVAPGQSVTVELDVAGTSSVVVRSKAYVTGTRAPDWQARATDKAGSRIAAAGAVGVSGYVSAGQAAQTWKTLAFSALSTGSTAATPPAPPVVAPPAPPVVAKPTATPAASGKHGAAAVGSTAYPVPSNAVFVSTSGSDSASGSKSAPVRTVTKALTKVSSGRTIVIRGGTYHEYFIVPPGKAVTIQSYPNEAVWFDGSSKVSGFTASGSAWRADGYSSFDASPTYTKGAPDGTAVGWTFLNPAHPMAAHPDQVWIDGAEQKQVGALSQVKAGTFFVDRGAKRLYLGTNPAGRSVQASTLSQAISLRAPGTTIRGLGFRRYASSVPQQGVITAYYPNQKLENVEVRDSATAGVGIFKPGSSLKNVTITGSGQIGLQASYADGLTVDNLSLRNSNDQNFNPTPSAGGFKVTTTRGFTMKNSEITGTIGNQFWTDQSTYDINLTNNTITNGTRWGIVLEISSKAVIAGNVVAGNAHDGIMISNTNNVSVWNNTLVNNGRSGLAIAQDKRRITQLSVSGHDRRRAQPDMSMPWTTTNVTVGNNIFTGGTGSKSAIYLVESWDRALNAEQMATYSNGNVFSQKAVGTPKLATVWGNAGAYSTNFVKFSDYVAATGRDRNSYHHLGASPVNGSYQAVAAISSRDTTVGQPLPAAVATKVGRAAGTRHLGAWR